MAPEHSRMFDELFLCVDTNQSYQILDAGSGETSLSLIHNKFLWSQVDAIIFPGDLRKRDSVSRVKKFEGFNFIEADIAKLDFKKSYDIIIAHLLFGEAETWGNSVGKLLIKLLSITKLYIAIIDFPEDPNIDFDEIKNISEKKGFLTIKDIIVERESPFVGKEFTGNYYRGILLKKI